MNSFSQQSKNTNDFFNCGSWSKELFGECFMKFRNFSCSTKLLPGFLRVAVDISCFIRGHDFWVDWLYVNYCELDCCVFFKSLPLFISELNLEHYWKCNLSAYSKFLSFIKCLEEKLKSGILLKGNNHIVQVWLIVPCLTKTISRHTKLYKTFSFVLLRNEERFKKKSLRALQSQLKSYFHNYFWK